LILEVATQTQLTEKCIDSLFLLNKESKVILVSILSLNFIKIGRRSSKNLVSKKNVIQPSSKFPDKNECFTDKKCDSTDKIPILQIKTSFICKMSQTYLLDWIPQINSTAVECFTAKRYDCHRLETDFTDKKFAPGPKPHIVQLKRPCRGVMMHLL
jgi:hypothetical protein